MGSVTWHSTRPCRNCVTPSTTCCSSSRFTSWVASASVIFSDCPSASPVGVVPASIMPTVNCFCHHHHHCQKVSPKHTATTITRHFLMYCLPLSYTFCLIHVLYLIPEAVSRPEVQENLGKNQIHHYYRPGYLHQSS